MSSRIRTVLGAAVAFVIALMGLGLTAGPATAAPGDAISFIVSGSTDFVAQTGTTSTQVIQLVNNGTDPLKFRSPPNISAPLHLDSYTGTSGEVILPGAAASLTITFTAGAVGTTSESANMIMSAADGSNLMLATVRFTTESTLNPPLHFVIDPTTVDFGAVSVGAFETKTLTIRNDGAVPLNVCTAEIMFYDTFGAALPDFTVTSSSLGGRCGYVSVGAQATFDVTYAPAVKTDAFRGLVAVTARYIPGEDVADTLTIDGVIAASAVDPVIVVPTPSPAASAAAPIAAAAAKPGAAMSAPQLAHTGAEPAFAIGFGTLTLALGGVALSIALGARRKARRG